MKQNPTNEQKLEKFIQRIEDFILELKRNNTIPVHAQINQFFYMQKLEELKLLVTSVRENVKRLEDLEATLEVSRREIFLAWKRDARWLIQHRLQRNLTASELPAN